MFPEAPATCQPGSLWMSEMIMDEMSHMGYSLKSQVILPQDPACLAAIYFPVSLCQMGTKPTLEAGSEKTPWNTPYFLF